MVVKFGMNMGERIRVDADQSNIIRWMSFFAIACVVLGHCRIGNDAVQRIIYGTFCQWHVPFFLLREWNISVCLLK